MSATARTGPGDRKQVIFAGLQYAGPDSILQVRVLRPHVERGGRVLTTKKHVGIVSPQSLSASSDLQSDSMGFGPFDQPASNV